MPISEQHITGLRDLLCNERNTPVLLQLARSITKNVCEIEEPEEALGYITAHVDDIHKLLSKRHITKELLFKYLHTRLPGTSTDFTKADLVMRIIQYWDQPTGSSQVTTQPPSQVAIEQEYPIHILARNFGAWFFDKYNTDTLTLSDLWSDSALVLKVEATDCACLMECESAEEVLGELGRTKERFGFYFNPNLAYSGVQGRTDPYGQVIVLCCGTLHTAERSVGIFECAFGLVRDPHTANHWKPKMFKFLFKSEISPPDLHTLTASETLVTALALPATNDPLD